MTFSCDEPAQKLAPFFFFPQHKTELHDQAGEGEETQWKEGRREVWMMLLALHIRCGGAV